MSEIPDQSQSELAEQRYEDEREPAGAEASRCHAILADGSRCPNAAETGRRYCALPEHQALADREGDEVVSGAADAAESRPGDVELEARAAGTQAAEIGGEPEESEHADERDDPAARPVAEAGEGEAEGYEQAESELRRAAERPEDADLTAEAQDPEPPRRSIDEPEAG